MSLVWFSSAQKDSDTSALIEEKTGLVIERDLYNSNVYIKFPDMSENTVIECKEMNSPMGVCFVDVENHFFAYGVPHEDAKTFNKSFGTWMYAMIYEIDGIIYNIPVNSGDLICEIFNTPKGTNANTSKDSFCIVPAYSSTGYGFIKNLFVNYDRFFNPGQKIIDDSGNVFITLGGYFLYYNGKNK